ncbi:hypothetical protein ALO40_200253 [Pseudomonas syringae pv. viburni]|uniref:Integrase n=1 Tax=Pseudomonas syringae pv. viburni TaxID=251703 RepID=A0A0Q0CZH3_9PSED|nr:hypothetical protein ALO40_200253 [Pseudomonas syringae pv. viburni]
MAKSFRIQVLAMMGGIVVSLVALICFYLLSNSLESYRGLLEGPVQVSQLVDEANLKFRSKNGKTCCCAVKHRRT